MIAYLSGKIIHQSEQQLILNTGNIGYNININKKQSEQFNLNQEVELFIYTKVREDEISLYGFSKTEELDFFKLLITVKGVGPKVALEILNENIHKVQTAIFQGNLLFLSKVPGIGKKTAERIILELKSKITPTDLDQIEETNAFNQENLEEVFDALSTLGYNRYQVNHVLKKIPTEIQSTEEIITYFLQNV